MFTAEDIKALAEAEVDDVLEDEDVVQNINSCFMEFAEQFRKTTTNHINGGEWAEHTGLAVVKITQNGVDYTGSFELSHDRTQIYIPHPGAYVVTSLVVPELITDIMDEVPVHDVFQAGIARYVGGLFKLKDNDMNPDGIRMKTEGATMIRQAAALLSHGDRRAGMRAAIGR